MSNSVATDQNLIRQYLQGSNLALERLINRHKERIFTAIIILVKDRTLAEDIFQDTFVKIINTFKRGKYKEEGKFLPWALRIAHNLCIDHFRKLKRRPGITAPDGTDIFDFVKLDESSAEERMIETQTSKKIKHLLDLLPEEQKEVVMMRHYFNFSFKEISELTGVSINTALGRMRYALINIRKLVKEKQISL